MLTRAIAALDARSTQWERRGVLAEALPPDRTKGKIDDSDHLNLFHFSGAGASGGSGGIVGSSSGGGVGGGSDVGSGAAAAAGVFAAGSTSDGSLAGLGLGGSGSGSVSFPGRGTHGDGSSSSSSSSRHGGGGGSRDDAFESVELTHAVFVRMASPRRFGSSASSSSSLAATGAAEDGHSSTNQQQRQRGQRGGGRLSGRSIVRSSTRGLRPFLSVRILNVDSKSKDYTEYCIWVLDVATGCEWVLRRRFKEFHSVRQSPTHPPARLNSSSLCLFRSFFLSFSLLF